MAALPAAASVIVPAGHPQLFQPRPHRGCSSHLQLFQPEAQWPLHTPVRHRIGSNLETKSWAMAICGVNRFWMNG